MGRLSGIGVWGLRLHHKKELNPDEASHLGRRDVDWNR